MTNSIDDFIEKMLGDLDRHHDIAVIQFNANQEPHRGGDQTGYQFFMMSEYLSEYKTVEGKTFEDYYLLDNDEEPPNITVPRHIRTILEGKENRYDFGFSGNKIYIIENDGVLYDFDAAKAIIGNEFDFKEVKETYGAIIKDLKQKKMLERADVAVKFLQDAVDHYKFSTDSREGAWIVNRSELLKGCVGNQYPSIKSKIDYLIRSLDNNVGQEDLSTPPINDDPQLRLF